MGGPQLEVIKFGFYVFYPVGTMLCFGGPFFYEKFVKDIHFWPDYETTYQPPKTINDVKSALEILKAEREERWKRALEKKE
ncbi:hypothetical protein G6F46_011485 [Rhizopus delemar]|uniref:Transmembrane protein n=2 Tax=Rhizopus TaxID=4842 RepID=A0A9P6YT89_9FUNG|nr:hypothetical protein G6F55_009435 [Rhizopus delemar]KAG1541365.1 hypothetical protein G6F51_007938 [Rhizopus arrhizus]KAG1489666.1 hypothetical protein G6F54_011272 [Rhizopus delemar]KAG1511215.1 hypothetical protein G6F53_006109 [Rhizopus delemar]KAG1515871.1 hypothetical protein G6F52_009577 [Rhizopus delemar]